MQLKKTLSKWFIFGLFLSLLFVFFPRTDMLGYTVYESRERFGLVWAIITETGQIKAPEIIVNVVLALLLTFLIFLFNKLVLSKLPKVLSITILVIFITLFMFFPGKEIGEGYPDCGPAVLCSGEEVELTTYGLVGDTFSHQYRNVESEYRPDAPIIFLNVILALSGTIFFGAVLRLLNNYRKPT